MEDADKHIPLPDKASESIPALRLDLTDPGKRDRAIYIAKSFESGIDSKRVVGYHGTSIESLYFIIDRGYLPGGEFHLYGNKRLLFICPNNKLIHLTADKGFSEDPYKMASSYASIIARVHFIWSEANPKWREEDDKDKVSYEINHIAAGILNDDQPGLKPKSLSLTPEAQESTSYLINKYKLSRDYLYQLYIESLKRQGVILGLSPDIVDLELVPGDDGQDIAIVCPQGLNLKYIEGIEPNGNFEFECLEGLQDKVNTS